MLLRSSSSPILNSWLPHSSTSSSSPEPEIVPKIPRTCSDSLSSSSRSPLSFSRNAHHHHLVSPTRRVSCDSIEPYTSDERDGSYGGGRGVRRTMSLGLAEVEGCEIDTREKIGLLSVLNGGGADGGSGGGGGGGGGSDGGDSMSTDTHYRRMIEADPRNPLLLANYAKFPKEVVGDLEKLEEYCSRAILANPNDGGVLSMYAHLIWLLHKDVTRAESYFEQAVKASPDDCYVQASYAHFLWDTEEDEAEEEVKEGVNCTPAHKLVHGVSPSPSSGGRCLDLSESSPFCAYRSSCSLAVLR